MTGTCTSGRPRVVVEEDWDEADPVAVVSRPPSERRFRRSATMGSSGMQLATAGGAGGGLRGEVRMQTPAAAAREALVNTRRAALEAERAAALEVARQAELQAEAEARAQVESLRRQAEVEAQQRIEQAEAQAAEVLRRAEQDARRARRMHRGLQARRQAAPGASPPTAACPDARRLPPPSSGAADGVVVAADQIHGPGAECGPPEA